MARKRKQKTEPDKPVVEQETNEAEAQVTESSSSPKVTYIVNGKTVDPEGNVVKD